MRCEICLIGREFAYINLPYLANEGLDPNWREPFPELRACNSFEFENKPLGALIIY